MLLFLRHLKHLEFMNDRFRRYLLYALGEMVLVVIGILIALQIDNWNTDRQQKALLESYLQGIARNMRDDAGELEALKAARLRRTQDAFRAQNFVTGARKQFFERDEIYFFRKVMSEAGQNLSFNADTSSLEAMQNAGVIERLQGQDIERLLSRYYDQVKTIEKLEMRLNEAINALRMQYSMSIPHDVEIWALDDPKALSDERFGALQPEYARVINGPAVRQMMGRQIGSTTIILEYERLLEVGGAFIRMVESGRREFVDENLDVLLSRETTGAESHATLVANGQLLAQHYYFIGVADKRESVFDFRSIEQMADSLHFVYPGSHSWAAIYLGYLAIEEGRPSQDFSAFDKLVLELKGDEGGEIVTVQIKDRDLPDQEIPDSVELRVSDEWQVYEIDLASFERTDLSILMQPLGFTFMREPQSFSLRTARYVRTD